MMTEYGANFSTELKKACFEGNMESAELYAGKPSSLDAGLFGACKGNHIEMVNFIVSKCADINNLDWCNRAFYGACLSGNPRMIQFVINMCGSDGPNWNEGLYAACKTGNLALCKQMLQSGATNLNMGVMGARNGEHKEMADFIVGYNPEYKIDWASCGGRAETDEKSNA
jgi:hypothetical protein